MSRMKSLNSLSGAGVLSKMSRNQRSPQRMMALDTSMSNPCHTQQKWKRKICIKRSLWKKREASMSSRRLHQLKKVRSGGTLGGKTRDLIMDSMSLRRHRLRRKMSETGMHSKNKIMTFKRLNKLQQM